MIDMQNLERAVRGLSKFSKITKKKVATPKSQTSPPASTTHTREELHEKRRVAYASRAL